MGAATSQIHTLRALVAAAAMVGAAAVVSAAQRNQERLPAALPPPPGGGCSAGSAASGGGGGPRASGLLDVLGAAVASIGPEGAARARAISREAAAVLCPSALAAAAAEAWGAFLQGEAPPLVALLARAAPAEDLLRAAALGALLPSWQAVVWRQDECGRSPLEAAIREGRGRGAQQVRALLRARASPVSRGGGGWTPLMWAAQEGDAEACEALLVSGASANTVSSSAGITALLCAAQADRRPLDVVRLLLKFGADPDMVPLQSPVDEHVDVEVRRALVQARRTRRNIAGRPDL